MKNVYALDMSNDTVKIGASLNPSTRLSAIEHASGLTVRHCFESKPLPDAVAFAIERACHETFTAARTNGEFFKITYAEACAEINRQVSEHSDADYIPIREKIQFLLEAAKLVKGDLRTRLVLKIEALIDGRELDDTEKAVASVTIHAFDFVADFIDKHCIRDPRASIPRPQLIRLIRERCPGAENASNKSISKALDSIDGLKKVKLHGTIHIKGIRLTEGNVG